MEALWTKKARGRDKLLLKGDEGWATKEGSPAEVVSERQLALSETHSRLRCPQGGHLRHIRQSACFGNFGGLGVTSILHSLPCKEDQLRESLRINSKAPSFRSKA
jgi:hypothetical protein